MSNVRYEVFKVEWWESERGWGQKPIGNSYYKTEEMAKKAIKDHWLKEHESNPSGSVPDYYIFPLDNGPEKAYVTEEQWKVIEKDGILRESC